MRDIWQANVQQMAQYVKGRSWTIDDEPSSPLGLSAQKLDELERLIGEPLPPQLRWLLSWAGEWQFGWRCREEDEDELPDDLSECTHGELQWSAKLLEEEDLRGQLAGWVEYHQELLEEFAEEDEEDSEETIKAYAAFWQRHFPFILMPNGDLLTIDTRNPDPQYQAVRYFFHDFEGDGLEGILLAPNLFSFISRLSALGCAGSEWFMGWGLFWRDDQHGFDLQSENARKWLAWLTQDAGSELEDKRPPRVPARSKADQALLLAAQAGDLDGVRHALTQGAQPDSEDLADLLYPDSKKGSGKGDTALVLAAQQNRLDMLEALLAAGASLATHELPLSCLLHHAGKDGHANAQTLRWLIERGARIDPWPQDRHNALHRLIDSDLSREDYLTLLDLMLARGCNPDVRSKDNANATALMRVGSTNQQRLLKAGANPQLRSCYGKTAMHYIQEPESIALLQAYGLDINDLSQDNDSALAERPLHCVLRRPWKEEEASDEVIALLQAMLEQGADPALPDGQGRNVWGYCQYVEYAEVLQRHLPFNPAARDANGHTVLHQLVRDQSRLKPHQRRMLAWWVAHGLDVNAQDKNGDTVLHYLVRDYNRIADDKVLKELSDMFGEKSSFMQDYKNSINGSATEISGLLALGARWDIENHKGQTPRQLLKPKYRKNWEQ